MKQDASYIPITATVALKTQQHLIIRAQPVEVGIAIEETLQGNKETP